MKKTMNLLFLFAVAITLAACSKSDGGNKSGDNGNYYFRFKMDGVQKEMPFKSANYSYVQSRKRHVKFALAGREKNTGESPNPTLSMYIDAAIMDGDTWKGADIVAGTYKGYQGENTTGEWGVVWNYNTNGLDGYWIYEEDFVLNLQQVDKNTAKGTFSGTLKNDQGKLMKITDGTFYVKVDYSETKN